MIAKLIDELATTPPPELGALIRLLEIVIDQKSYRDLFVEVFKEFPNFEKRQTSFELGHFNDLEFTQLIHACGDGRRTTIYLLQPLLQRLKDWGLVLDNGAFGGNSFKYQWHRKRISGFAALGILDNVLLGAGYIAMKYRRSVPAIFINKNGDDYTGTGFITTSRPDSAKYVVITAKHNVDADYGIKFINFSKPEGYEYKPLSEKWILHPKLDLALLPIQCSALPVPIFPVGSPMILSRTITLGYPRIATTDDSYVLAHGGELNAIVNTYFGDQHLIISNAVAPGNSGGPVLDEAGLCIGLVVSSFETEHEGGVNKANAAIPSRDILDFIAPHCS